MELLKTLGLFAVTAVAEILGCYLAYRVVRMQGRVWLLALAAVSLAVFAWLLTLHPEAAGRTYAAYGAVYVATAIGWLWLVEQQRPSFADLLGAAVCLVGMGIIVLGNRPA